MKLNIIILKSKRGLKKQDSKHLRGVVDKHARKAGKLLGVDLLNITVHFSKNVIPETGEAGYATGRDWVQITIDPTRKSKESLKIISEIIPATVYHEVNHIAREKYVGESKNLLEAIVAEGLADLFAEEHWSKFKAPWSTYQQKKIQPFLKSLKNEKNSRKYSHSDWFFGTGKYPRWLGYKLGRYIAQSAKEKKRNLAVLKMTKMTANKIVKLSGISI